MTRYARCISRDHALNERLPKPILGQVSLKVPRLRRGSVPTPFPGCPSYLSKQDGGPSRLSPEGKRIHQEAFDLARAISESAACY
ncbi:unnamed protein product, partial [Ixodes pacificus]